MTVQLRPFMPPLPAPRVLPPLGDAARAMETHAWERLDAFTETLDPMARHAAAKARDYPARVRFADQQTTLEELEAAHQMALEFWYEERIAAPARAWFEKFGTP